MSIEFPKGTRVRLSADALKLVPRTLPRVGVVTGKSRDGLLRWVLWDGTRSAQAWHVDFLELAKTEGET